MSVSTSVFTYRGLPEVSVFADGTMSARFTRSCTPIQSDAGNSEKKYRFTNRVKRSVRSKCVVLGNTFKGKCWFITLTSSSFIETNVCVSQFIENMRKQKVILQYVWVRERQERGANHWHLLFSSSKTWLDYPKIKKAWNSALFNNGFEASNNSVRFGSKPKVHSVEGVSRYIAKYVSKQQACTEGELTRITHSSHMQYNKTMPIERVLSCPCDVKLSFVNNFFGFVMFDSQGFYEFYKKNKIDYEIG